MTSPAPSSSVWLYALSGMADAVPATLPPGVAVYAAVDGPGMYIYANVAQPWAARLGPQRALQPTLAMAGASQGRPAAFRYVVETDVLPGMEDEFNAWYDTEHMPGLAAVPGTVRAQRFVVADGSPRYHACYDLETIDTLDSPPWLAVRGTAWSSRVRPAFRHTRRTMFRPLTTAADPAGVAGPR